MNITKVEVNPIGEYHTMREITMFQKLQTIFHTEKLSFRGVHTSEFSMNELEEKISLNLF